MPEDVLELPGHFVFDVQHRELRDASGHCVPLRRQTSAVLHCLALRAGFVVTKEELMQRVWPGVVVGDDSLVQCVLELRRALGDTERRTVRTEPRVGYRLLPANSLPGTSVGDDLHSPQLSFEQEIAFATSYDGIRVAFATAGVGPAVVRTAHWMTHLDWDWRSPVMGPMLRRLADRYRLVRYDGRGCGLSDRGVSVATLDDEVRDLDSVANAAGLGRFSLIGRSQGAAIAIRYAARNPERVCGLVIVGGFARGALRRGERSSSPKDYDAVCHLLLQGWGQDNAALRQLFTTYMFPDATPEQIESFNHMQRVSASPQDAAVIHRMVAEYDASPDLTDVCCPTLVLHNPNDSLVPFEEARLIAAGIPGARLETFAGRNHTPLPGTPEYEPAMHCIEAFLARTGAGSVPVRGTTT